MAKYKVLGLVNLLLFGIFGYFIVSSGFSTAIFSSMETLFRAQASNVVLTISAFTNVLLAVTLLFNRKYKKPFLVYIILTLATICWFIQLFIAYYIPLDVSTLYIFFLLLFTIYYFVQKISKKTAMFVVGMTLFTSFVAATQKFEEDYCWRKSASNNTVELNNNGHFSNEHMLCHETFRFSQAIKETIVLQ